jgi:hypothetical protein
MTFWCFHSDVLRNCQPFYLEEEECCFPLLYAHMGWSVHVVSSDIGPCIYRGVCVSMVLLYFL